MIQFQQVFFPFLILLPKILFFCLLKKQLLKHICFYCVFYLYKPKQLLVIFMYKDQYQEIPFFQQEQQGPNVSTKLFQPKFIKSLNFQQNSQKWRERRIKEKKKLTQIKELIYDKYLKQFGKQNKNDSTQEKSSQYMAQVAYKGHIIKSRFKKKLLHGDTQIIYENGIEFKGTYKNGKMRTGRFDFKNGYQYWGELEGKKFMGKGTLKCPDGKRITGIWNCQNIIGKAQIQYSSGEIYFGQIQKFQKHGQGYLFFKNGNKYIGHFQKGGISGLGIYFQNDGKSDEGIWKNGELIQHKTSPQNNQQQTDEVLVNSKKKLDSQIKIQENIIKIQDKRLSHQNSQNQCQFWEIKIS